jgi:DNA-binding MarR family transcriptional regulator
LTRRLDRELFPWQISPPEGLVLVTAQVHSPAPVWMIRRETGLRGSTLSSILTRLEARGLLVRTRAPDDPRAVEVTLTAAGDELAGTAAATLAEIDLELSSFTSPDERAGVGAVYEAAGAMTPSPAPFDY